MSDPSPPKPVSRLSVAQTIAAVLAALILLAGLLVWFRIDLGKEVYSTAKLWFFDNYGVSEAWSTSLAAIAAALLVANASVIFAAVFFGWRKTQALAITVVVAVLGAAVFEYRASDQCFHRRSGVPLCSLFRSADGSLVVRRSDGSAAPSTWRLLRAATKEDVVRYGATLEDRERRKPKRVEINSCSRETKFFDSETGEVLVYFTIRDGVYEFFSAPGFHPLTQEQLRAVDKPSIAAICKSLAQKNEPKDKPKVGGAAADTSPPSNAAAPQPPESLKTARLVLNNLNCVDSNVRLLRDGVPAYEVSVPSKNLRDAHIQAGRYVVDACPQPKQDWYTCVRLGEYKVEAAQMLRLDINRHISCYKAEGWISLTVKNEDCRPKDFFLNERQVGTAPPNKSLTTIKMPGTYRFKACTEGTGCQIGLFTIDISLPTAVDSTVTIPRDPSCQ